MNGDLRTTLEGLAELLRKHGLTADIKPALGHGVLPLAEFGAVAEELGVRKEKITREDMPFTGRIVTYGRLEYRVGPVCFFAYSPDRPATEEEVAAIGKVEQRPAARAVFAEVANV